MQIKNTSDALIGKLYLHTHTHTHNLPGISQEMPAFLCAPFLCQWRAELHF